MDLIEKIGPILGLVAFLGLALLTFLIIQQSREVRRLRDWAGRGPERAEEAAEATAAVAEARGEEAEEREPGRLTSLRRRAGEMLGPRWEELDRHLPVDGRYLVAALAAGFIAAAVLTSGFGLVGGGEEAGKEQKAAKEAEPEAVEVAVLNATQVAGIQGVPGLADKVAAEVVKPAGFDVAVKDNATSGFAETIVMYEPAAKASADELAAAVEDQLGPTGAEPMAPEVSDLAEGAAVALIIGQDDSEF